VSEAQHGGERNEILSCASASRRSARTTSCSRSTNPYQTAEGAVPFLDEAEISDEDRRKIYHRNAERIFGIPDGDEPA